MAKRKKPQILKEIQKQSIHEINYGLEKSISFSQASIYNSCPKQWDFIYKKKKIKKEDNIHSIFGNAIHTTIQNYLKVMYEQSAAEADRIDLIDFFENELREEYTKSYNKNKKHFSSPEELHEFYDDGVSILEFFKKKRGSYFSKRGWWLVGIELPIVIHPNEKLPNVLFSGYLDLVFYHEPTNKFKIIDIKTSTQGWGKWQKEDVIKQYQLILYKKYFAQLYNINVDDIEIEFFIVRRKIWENSDYPMKRIQTFTPASGKVKINKASKFIDGFISKVFDNKGYKDKNHQAIPSKWNCKFCPLIKEGLCDLGKPYVKE